MSIEQLQRTPLYDTHVSLGGKIVPFAGWELPVQYSGVIAEHNAVRSACGIFDVSHMGEIIIKGVEAEKLLQLLTCNDVSTLTDGKAQYSALINAQGGVVDDIIIYRFGAEHFFVCVNASNTEKDFAWIKSHNKTKATVENSSSIYGQIALQGPRAVKVVEKIPGGTPIAALPTFHFFEGQFGGVSVIAARTGYTGEDGFEFFVPWGETEQLWKVLTSAGLSEGLIPCGLGARDSLRLEACYPLHGHELGDDITAIESGLGWIVKPDKGEFIGRDILARQKKDGAPRTLIGFFLDDPGIARHGDLAFSTSGSQIGWVTSGTKTPTVGRALGLAIVDSQFAAEGKELLVEVRGKRLKAHVVKKPFYRRSK